ncbi:Ras association domain-containing protein 7, partial [Podiceps cristatus]
MELKVWVDGIQRVVCGVSEQTTCQEVVIALARAIGEPSPSAEGMPLCGWRHLPVLPGKRKPWVDGGPARGWWCHRLLLMGLVAERPSSEGTPQAPERTFIRASLPIKPRPIGTDAPLSRDPKKTMTFNLGPTGSSDLFAVGRWRHQVREGMDLEGGGVFQPSKEELFRRVLRQQEQLHEEFGQRELRLEKECERERQERGRSLRASLEEYTQRIYELSARTEALQEEIQWEMAERAKRGKETPVPSPTDLEDMAAQMKRDLEAKVKQSSQLESNLASVEKALEEAERNLQVDRTRL